jgi:hypothetical protein
VGDCSLHGSCVALAIRPRSAGRQSGCMFRRQRGAHVPLLRIHVRTRLVDGTFMLMSAS